MRWKFICKPILCSLSVNLKVKSWSNNYYILSPRVYQTANSPKVSYSTHKCLKLFFNIQPHLWAEVSSGTKPFGSLMINMTSKIKNKIDICSLSINEPLQELYFLSTTLQTIWDTKCSVYNRWYELYTRMISNVFHKDMNTF